MGYRYIGNKSKLIDFIITGVKSHVETGQTVCDLMTGTASVASELRLLGYNVTAADMMTYSYHHATVTLLIKKPPLFKGFINIAKNNIKHQEKLSFDNYDIVIDYLNSLEPQKGLFWNEYSVAGTPANGYSPRSYFSPENAEKIDAIRQEILRLSQSGYLSDIEHSLLLHDLIIAANDVANIAGTYGHYMSKLCSRAQMPIILRRSAFNDYCDTSKHTVLLGRAEDLSPSISCNLCYIDPPYMKRQYAANYHILETIAREDTPEVIGVSGLRDWWDQYSDFCSKIKIFGAFTKIITRMDCPLFLVSYSEDGIIPINQLIAFFRDFGEVKVDTMEHKRFKSNKSLLPQKLKEYLIHIQINH